MTREEAIQWLTNEKWENANNKYKKEWNEAFDLAIEALSLAELKPKFESADAVDVYKAHEEEHLNIINRIKELQYAILGEKHQLSHGRLIDADELKKHLDGAWEELNDDGERKGVRLARWYLISAPTVDTTIDVVRCKDCRYQIKEKGIMWCSHEDGVCGDAPDNFYCAYTRRWQLSLQRLIRSRPLHRQRQKRSPKANARLSTGQRPKRVARQDGTTPRSLTSSAAATPPSTTTST